MARQVDTLFLFLVGVAAFFVILIFTLVIVFAVKYRRRSEADRPPPDRWQHLAGDFLERCTSRAGDRDVCLGRQAFLRHL